MLEEAYNALRSLCGSDMVNRMEAIGIIRATLDVTRPAATQVFQQLVSSKKLIRVSPQIYELVDVDLADDGLNIPP